MTKGDMGTRAKNCGVSVHSSPFLDSLIGVLAERLEGPVEDPFASDVVVVPNIGVRDWLQRELSTRLGSGTAGIVANIRFLFAQQFVNEVLMASGFSSTRGWDLDNLTWTVHRAIDAVGRETIPGAEAKPLTVARIVADLFDRYSVHRPSMLKYWRAGRAVDAVEPLQDLPGHLEWQQRLYEQVARDLDQGSPVDRLSALDERVRSHGLEEGLSERIFLFGFVTVNATIRAVIEAAGMAREVHVFLAHPSMRTSDTARKVLSEFGGGYSPLEPREQTPKAHEGNPLLARWGRLASETPRVLTGTWSHIGSAEEESSTVLEALRRAIVEDRPLNLAPLPEEDEVLSRGDGSIQVHACHGKVRQVEVLRNALLHLLEDDPTLTLDDISIQCPDLVSFAPIVAAIFSAGSTSAAQRLPSLDVSIADRSLIGDNPYQDAFWSLLELASSRCGVGEVVSMLSMTPIRRRFEIDDELLARALDWFESLGVKFGLDTDHRRRWDVPAKIDVGTWDAALDRLYMGLAVPAEVPILGPGGIVPHDDVSVTDAPGLSRVSEFLTRLRRLISSLDGAHTIIEWSEILNSVIDDFFDVSQTRDFACRDIVDAIARVVDGAVGVEVADSDRFSFDEVSRILSELIVTFGSRPRFRSGAITVTDLLPQQGVPYRVIALLGADEAMFATGGMRGDDVLSLRPCIGDPMPSAAGRMQLLNVLLAAKDAVVITCDGADINNNKSIPLPVPVQELLEAAVAVIESDTRTGSRDASRPRGGRILTSHPRQAFASGTLTSGSFRDDRPFTFDPVALEVHGRLQSPPTPILATRRAVDGPVPSGGRITLDQMRKVLTKPAEYFVQDVLGLRLPSSQSEASDDVIDFSLSNLDFSRAGRDMLDRLMRSTGDVLEAAKDAARLMALGGHFPPGRLGEKASQQVISEVLEVLDLLGPQARSHGDFRSIDIDDVLAPGSTNLVMTGAIGDILGNDLIRPAFTRFRNDLLLDPWIELALATYAEPEYPWKARLVARGNAGKAVAHIIGLAGSDAQQRRASAERVISTVLELAGHMQRGRVPYLARTSDAIFSSSLQGSRFAYEKDAEYSVATRFLFGRVSWDDFISEESLVDDPPGNFSIRASRFAHFVWLAFSETTVAVSGGEETQ